MSQRRPITLSHCGALELPEPDLRRCREMTLPKGLMRQCIDELCTERPPRAEVSQVIQAKDELGELLGWALLFKNRFGRHEVYVYVAKQSRRRGIGSALMVEAQRLKPRHKILVRPWDGSSFAFYSRFPRFVPQGTATYLVRLREEARQQDCVSA